MSDKTITIAKTIHCNYTEMKGIFKGKLSLNDPVRCAQDAEAFINNEAPKQMDSYQCTTIPIINQTATGATSTTAALLVLCTGTHKKPVEKVEKKEESKVQKGSGGPVFID